jgi:nitrogen regulatory protein P-II 2
MKFIVAIIRPSKFDEVRDALTQLGVQGLTVIEVRGFGRQKGQTEIYRGSEYQITLIPKLKIEVATTDELAEKVVEAIQHAAQTGKIGDGKVFVFDMEAVMRIRTAEQGSAAL